MRVWKRTNLPRPMWNMVLQDAHGKHIAVPDAWFDVGLAWEIDSHEFHFRRADYAKTVNRNARYAAAGVLVLQTLPNRLRNDRAAVAAELVAAYRAAESRPRPAVRVVGPVAKAPLTAPTVARAPLAAPIVRKAPLAARGLAPREAVQQPPVHGLRKQV